MPLIIGFCRFGFLHKIKNSLFLPTIQHHNTTSATQLNMIAKCFAWKSTSRQLLVFRTVKCKQKLAG